MVKKIIFLATTGLLAGCGIEGNVIDVATFVPPDTLGKTLLVSRHDASPLGEVTYIAFGDSGRSQVRLVTYFSDGSTLTEKLTHNMSGELVAEDGEPRFLVHGNTVERKCAYARATGCADVNMNKFE